jgi:LacI family transcriptional regulator
MTDARETKRVTIFDVAAAAGVSYSTVSRVVNGYAHIKPETRRRVEVAMRDLGYVANLSARSLAGGRSQTVGLLVYELGSSFFMALVQGIDAEVSRMDYDMLLCTTHQRKQRETEHVGRLAAGLVDGLLIVLPRNLDAYVTQLRRQGMPFVLLDHDADEEDVDHDSNVVRATSARGGEEAATHLIGLGHRRIGVITGPLHVGSARRRLEGFRAALERHGIPFDPALQAESDFLEASGYAAAIRLLTSSEPPTAIFASSDAVAVGVLNAAGELGLSVPGDLSIVGFDDLPEASYVRPQLTTVRQPVAEMGRVATRRLVEMIESPDGAGTAQVIELPTKLLVRGSTAPPR